MDTADFTIHHIMDIITTIITTHHTMAEAVEAVVPQAEDAHQVALVHVLAPEAEEQDVQKKTFTERTYAQKK